MAELDGSGNLLARYFYPTGSHSPDFVEYAGTLYGIVKEPNGTVSLVIAVDDPSNEEYGPPPPPKGPCPPMMSCMQ